MADAVTLNQTKKEERRRKNVEEDTEREVKMLQTEEMAIIIYDPACSLAQ